MGGTLPCCRCPGCCTVTARPEHAALVKAGCNDSTPHITVIENFHGAGLLNGTARGSGRANGGGRLDGGRLEGGRRVGKAPQHNCTSQHTRDQRLNSAGKLNGTAEFAPTSATTGGKPTDTGATGAPKRDAAAGHPGSMPDPSREARTGYSSEPAQPSPRSVGQLPRPEHLLAAGPDLTALLEDGAALLDSARLSATAEARLLGFVEAADFAGRVEEISRSVEYLQIVAAQAVERARKEAQQAGPGSSAAAPGWRTGWTDPPTGTDMALDSTAEAPSTIGAAQSTVGSSSKGGVSGEGHSVLDDGYRNAAQFLRARLRIGIGEARRRLALAPTSSPRQG